MTAWRNMTSDQWESALLLRNALHRHWTPPADRGPGDVCSHLFTAVCLDREPLIGESPERMADFENRLLELMDRACIRVHAWVVMPDHYHFMAQTEDCQTILRALEQLHLQMTHAWNEEEGTLGRRIWTPAVEMRLESSDHFWSGINYIHHNPIMHGHAERWQGWLFGSAAGYLQHVGLDEARRLLARHPVENIHTGWDD